MVPGTMVKLLSGVRASRDLAHTYSFTSPEVQAAWMSSMLYGSYQTTDFTYQREAGKMRVPFNAESLHAVNYVMFQNANYSTKWFYAFVDSIEYKSESSSEITFTIDPWQTYLFDITWRPSLIEREHVSNDAIGLHRVPENLDVGDLITIKQETINVSELCIVVASTYNPLTSTDAVGAVYSGVYQGCQFFTFSTTNVSGLNSFLASMAGKESAVMGVFMYPKNLLGAAFVEGGAIAGTSAVSAIITFGAERAALGAYTPRNNKLFTYPFTALYGSNNNGGSAVWKMEDFSDPTDIEFLVSGDIGPNPTVYCMPFNYKSNDENYDEALALTQYPFCSWNYDTFKSYLAQNIVSAPLSIAGSAIGLATGIATKNPLTIASGVIGMAETIGGFVEKSFLPNTSKGTLAGSGTVAVGAQTITLHQKSVNPQTAAIIDAFFDVYGYKTLRLDYPQTAMDTRPHWNFLKLAESNIFGNMPHKYLTELKNALRQGVTFWHDWDMYNYDRDNS